MKLLFDLSATQPMHGYDFHGGGEYGKTVFLKLCENLSDIFQVDVFYNPKQPLDAVLANTVKQLNLTECFCEDESQISLLLNKNKYDIFYSALPYAYYSLRLPPETKFIYTIHGLRTIECPWDKYAPLYKKQELKYMLKAPAIGLLNIFFPNYYINHVRKKNISNLERLLTLTKNQILITVSSHTKYSLNYFFPNLSLSTIKTLYSPQKTINNKEIDDAMVLDKYLIKSRKYILLIGGDRYEKGAIWACKALYKLLRTNKSPFLSDIKVVILGIKNHPFFSRMTNHSNSFVFEPYVSAPHLEVLYKNAHLFMYPTLNEGFGYPPLEAMKHDTLCMCSANSAVTEICSDAVLYFNPKDAVETGIRVLQSFDENIKKEKTEKMRERVKIVNEKQDKDLEKLIKLIKGGGLEG
jgi:hypothetical protein